MKRLMIMAAMMAVVACGDDSSTGDDDGSDDKGNTPTKDAGRDSGKVDARSGSTDDDNGDDDNGDDDAVTDDDPKADAGSKDATVANNDAGKTDASTGGGDAGGAACALLTYATFGKAFEEKYCASCHAASVKGSARGGAPADEVFDTLEQIVAAKAVLKKEVVTDKSMPFGAGSKKPTDAERTQFGQFLDCGPK